jgi:adenylosuccinate synthase
MGRRGEGTIVDGLSERADIVARFQGGQQRGPHPRHRRPTVYKLSLLPSGLVRGASLGYRQRRRSSTPGAPPRRDPSALAGQGVHVTPDILMALREHPPILPVHGELDRAREGRRACQDRHHGPRHRPGLRGQGGPPHRPRGRPRRPRDAGPPPRPPPPASRRAPPGPRLPSLDTRRPGAGHWTRWPRRSLPFAKRSGRSDDARRAGSAPLRGRQGAPRHSDFGTIPVRDLLPTHSPALAPAGPGIGPPRRRRALASQGLLDPRGRGAPSPTELFDAGTASAWASGARVRHRHGPQAPLRLVRRGARAPDLRHLGRLRHALTKLDVLDGFETPAHLHRATSSTGSASTSCPPPPTSRRA